MKQINLRTLLCSDRVKLPSWVDTENCIYRIHNLVTDKSYIGQARWFYGRFVANPEWMTHLGGIRHGYCHIHNSIRKHGSRNFEVSILESDLSNRDEMNSKEVYWIAYFDSFNNGYNSDKGGTDMSPCWAPESVAKKLESDRRNHGGVLAIHTDEAKQNSIRSREEIYGSAWGTVNNSEVYERLKEERGGDYMAACHTPEAIAKRIQSDKDHHGGVMAMHTPEAKQASSDTRLERYGSRNGILGYPEIRKKAVATERERYGGKMAWHSEVHHNKSSITQMFNSINRNLERIGYEPDIKEYEAWFGPRHCNRVYNWIHELEKDERFTPLMRRLFKSYLNPTNSD